MEGTGEDTDGSKYNDVEDMWRHELDGDGGRAKWYERATQHWDSQEPNLNGVLGGYPETNGPDLRESKRFLELVQRAASAPCFGTVLDCGAGIGRVTTGLLLKLFERVDLVEPCRQLLETARREITDPRADRFMTSSLQLFEPEANRYDVIWAQWVLLYLPDDDLVQFLSRCRCALRTNGLVCVKENVVLEGNWVVDKEDNSIARTDSQYKAIFKQAGFKVAHEMKQACWPQHLIPVKMYAIAPAQPGGQPAAKVSKRPAADATLKRPAADSILKRPAASTG